ncbi:hypothetical protein BGX34_003613 [Mortierella sp. NVP85]|nr:hypothetical protein BGX34_003613 [Mortierella sp. NVP85]
MGETIGIAVHKMRKNVDSHLRANTRDWRLQHSLPKCLARLTTLFKRLNHAMNLLLVSFILLIEELRFAPAFIQNNHLDVVWPTANSTVGSRIFLDTSLLNFDNSEERKRARTWLLPLLKSSVVNTKLDYIALTLHLVD